MEDTHHDDANEARVTFGTCLSLFQAVAGNMTLNAEEPSEHVQTELEGEPNTHARRGIHWRPRTATHEPQPEGSME